MHHLPQQNEKIILGIDPGTQTTGYGIVALNEKRQFRVIDYGCIKPSLAHSLSLRYKMIFNGLQILIERHKPSAVAVETQYIHRNPQSGLKLGMARGIAVLAATLQDIPIFEYAPTRAKRAVVGRGNASKAQVQAMIQTLLCLPELPYPEDAADALALAICHGQAFRLGGLVPL